MNTVKLALFGFVVIVFLVCADLVGYYLNVPSEAHRPIRLLLATVAIPYGGFMVRVMHVNPIIGQASVTDAMKGNGAITGEHTNESDSAHS